MCVDADLLISSFFPHLIASCTSVNEIRGGAAECLSGKITNHSTMSLKQQEFEAHPQNEYGLTTISSVAFKSLPPMNINERPSPEDVQILQNQNPQPSETGARIISECCPESIACDESTSSFMNKDVSPNLIEVYVQKKYFAPHWSFKDVNDALEVSLTKVLICIMY